MRADDLEQVRPLRLFRDLTDAHFERLMRGAYVQSFPEHVELIREGEPCDFVHIVLTGTVELFSAWNDRESVMDVIRPVATFILAAAIKDAPYLMSARTIERSRIVLLPSTDVRAVFDESGAFARAIVTELAGCFRGVVKHAKDLKLRSSVERLANYLVRLHREAGEAPVLQLDIEKRRLASYLGMTPENLSRAFKTLAPYGVKVEGSSVSLEDMPALLRLAKPTPLIDDPDH